MNKAKLLDFLNSWAEGVIKIGQAFLDETNYKPDLIGFHGQTIFHNPEKKITKQLGDG